MASQTVIDRLRAGGIVSPKVCIAEAERAKLPLHVAAALLEKESGGGSNVFGHDRDGSGRYIFPAQDGTVKVTKELYLEYKRRRIASENKAMQGVGPCQLTWFSFQDDADGAGGCWKPQINMRIGFGRLAGLMRQHGDSVGARMYNGSSDAAVAYSADLLKKAAAWKTRLAGAAPARAVPAGAANLPRRGPGPEHREVGPLRRGDGGAKVARLTQRLARTRSKSGTRYLAKPRGRLDGTVEAGLKAFQAEHGLEPDGVYGPLTQRKLNRTMRLQEHRKPAAADAPAQRSRTRLTRLVAAVHGHDAETGEAWDALVAYAAKLRQLHARVEGKAETGARLSATVSSGFAAVTAALHEIDGTLDTLVAEQPPADTVHAATAAVPAEAAVASGPDRGGPATVEVPNGVMVTQALRPPPPPPEGPVPPTVVPADVPRRRDLTELSDDELLEHIDRLDRSLDRARAAMIKRVALVEKDVERLAPKPRGHAATPRRPTPRPEPQPADLGPKPMSHDQVRALQKGLNAFTEKLLKSSLGPLMADGVKGHATKKRIRQAKFYLGYTGRAAKSSRIDSEFMRRLEHPRSPRFSNPAMLTRAVDRRRKARQGAKLSAAPRAGVATFDGKPVAAWLSPYLVWARKNGWQGTLNSGWRDPAHSEQLCRNICGAPTCPGRCAGRSSNHAGSVKPAGAVDVSDYGKFAELMRRCPLEPRIFNALGAQDPVHFSASGR
jgi:peptidoglycan hydrolase-like protein with peptidoglycan-binding domain